MGKYAATHRERICIMPIDPSQIIKGHYRPRNSRPELVVLANTRFLSLADYIELFGVVEKDFPDANANNFRIAQYTGPGGKRLSGIMAVFSYGSTFPNNYPQLPDIIPVELPN